VRLEEFGPTQERKHAMERGQSKCDDSKRARSQASTPATKVVMGATMKRIGARRGDERVRKTWKWPEDVMHGDPMGGTGEIEHQISPGIVSALSNPKNGTCPRRRSSGKVGFGRRTSTAASESGEVPLGGLYVRSDIELKSVFD
jgi:hypothetical protein